MAPIIHKDNRSTGPLSLRVQSFVTKLIYEPLGVICMCGKWVFL